MSGFLNRSLLIGAAEILCRIPLVFTIGYMARVIGPDAYGNWVILMAFQTFVLALVSQGLPSSLSRFVPAASAGLSKSYLGFAFRCVSAPILLAIVLAFFLRQFLTELLGVSEEYAVLLPIAVVMVGAMVADGFLDAYFKARMAVGRQVAFILVRTLAEVCAVLAIFPYWAGGVESLGLYMACVVIVKAVSCFFLARQPQVAEAALISEQRREFRAYGLHFLPTVLLGWFVSSCDRLILNELVSKHEVGVYVFAANLAAYFSFLGAAVFPLLLPRASQLYDQGDLAGLREAFRLSQALFLKIWLVAMLGVTLFAPDVLIFTAGDGFAEGAIVLVVLCFSVGLDQYLGVYQWVFHLVKKPQWIFRLYLMQSILLAAIMAVCVSLGGVSWAPFAALIGCLVLNAFRYLVSRRHLPLDLPIRAIFSILASGVVFFSAAQLAPTLPVPVKIVLLGGAVVMMLLHLARQRDARTHTTHE